MITTITAIVLVICALKAAAEPLPLVFVSGDTPYAVGRGIGEALRADFLQLLVNDTDFLAKIVPWARTHTAEVSSMLAHGKTAFPFVAEELRGLGDGLQLAKNNDTVANYVEIISVRPEIEAFMRKELGAEDEEPNVRGCCDVLLRTAKHAVHSHNEDWDNSLRSLTRMICVRETFDGKQPRTICGLVYPGYLLGNTFGWSTDGFSVSTNAMPPRPEGTNGVARYWANRHVLSADNYDDAVQRVRDMALVHGLVHGYATSLACHRTGRLSNFELAHTRIAEKSLEKGDWVWHVNMYTRMENVSAFRSVSSEHRRNRLQTLPMPQDATDVEHILGDRGDAQWPIYRNSTPPDTGATLATAVFDVTAGTVTIFSLTNPGSSNPVAVLKLPMFPGENKLSTTMLIVMIALAAVAVILAMALFAVTVVFCTNKSRNADRRPLIQ